MPRKKAYSAPKFMRPAFEVTDNKAVKLFADTLNDVLEEIAKTKTMAFI